MTYERKCIACKIVKPLTRAHWHVNAECSGGFQHCCKACTNVARRADVARRAEGRRIRGERHHSEKTSARICSLCSGLAHRVSGATCERCGLAHRNEVRPEFVLRKAGE